MSVSTTKENANEHRLSRNYRGWRPNQTYSDDHRNVNGKGKGVENENTSRHSDDHRNESTSGQSKWGRKKIEYSPKQQLARTTTIWFGKLTLDNKHILLPKILDIYNNKVDNIEKLEIFMSIIFERSTVEPIYYNKIFIDIFTELLLQQNSYITQIQFKQCLSRLCEKHFKRHLNKPKIEDIDDIADIEWCLIKQKRSLMSVSTFIGKLTSSQQQFIEICELLNYLDLLFKDERNEDNVEAVCRIFTEISKFINHDNRNIKLKNAKMNTINVNIRSYALVYGYIGGHGVNIPPVIINLCIGYYDVNCYLLRYYERLENMKRDEMNYGMRIRMIILNAFNN